MKSFVTMSDAGSVAIGTKYAWFLIPNGYGDGETSVLVFDEYQEWNDFSKQHPGWRHLIFKPLGFVPRGFFYVCRLRPAPFPRITPRARSGHSASIACRGKLSYGL